MAEFVEDNAIYRGTVLSMKGNCSTIQFIDFGNQAETPNEKIYNYDASKYDHLDGLAFEVKIHGIDLSDGEVLGKIEAVEAFDLNIVEIGDFLKCSSVTLKDGSNLKAALGLSEVKQADLPITPSSPITSECPVEPDVPSVKLDGKVNFAVQPAGLFAPDNEKPFIAFCAEDFDFDASADFNTMLCTYAKG